MPTRVLSEADFPTPPEDRWFEDYVAGAVYEYGYITVSEAEILDFATTFDPQPIHVDRAYAESGPFGGIIGSGWHSGSIAMRLIADHYLSRVASLASPGLDELRWQVPLRPGDTLSLRATILQARVSKTRPDRGVVLTGAELINQDGGKPVTFRATNFLRLRASR